MTLKVFSGPESLRNPDLTHGFFSFLSFFLFFFWRFYLFIFREKGKEGERGGEKHLCVVASYVPSAGDLTCNPGTCPDWQPFGWQASTQSTEPHQPGPNAWFLMQPDLWDSGPPWSMQNLEGTPMTLGFLWTTMFSGSLPSPGLVWE